MFATRVPRTMGGRNFKWKWHFEPRYGRHCVNTTKATKHIVQKKLCKQDSSISDLYVGIVYFIKLARSWSEYLSSMRSIWTLLHLRGTPPRLTQIHLPTLPSFVHLLSSPHSSRLGDILLQCPPKCENWIQLEPSRISTIDLRCHHIWGFSPWIWLFA